MTKVVKMGPFIVILSAREPAIRTLQYRENTSVSQDIQEVIRKLFATPDEVLETSINTGMNLEHGEVLARYQYGTLNIMALGQCISVAWDCLEDLCLQLQSVDGERFPRPSKVQGKPHP